MTFKSYSDHTKPIFSNLKILNLYNINEYLTSLFVFRYFIYIALPEIFKDYFVVNKDIHNNNTRHASLLHEKCYRKYYNKHTLSTKGIVAWNNIPLRYKEIRSYALFKLTMKKHPSRFLKRL